MRCGARAGVTRGQHPWDDGRGAGEGGSASPAAGSPNDGTAHTADHGARDGVVRDHLARDGPAEGAGRGALGAGVTTGGNRHAQHEGGKQELGNAHRDPPCRVRAVCPPGTLR
ncbi:hypothetical protein RSP_1253 [Cereibacter sphaeroides 2.4.1]|uniref:Uncharacterized protein n=1 Tax=Cereibacter sphaeroides (strain ATCC 17023 / DSM 158 / JCM 6121 / CCUG 31486 / LMG 2827 / NBRC 12203 / NCIMB 8253 / ATH 2.4.1.) TaxID=272943 RepID=Q3IYF2_CERS4|nr:hypothetical protein RSP_1253 [Cereibacter sphaeroides 2.4.1]AXC62619.1 hypothetical protein DQL45_15010 [Cereibacter sphaeroides 2.4.1]QHA11540.1 hypothetical protein GQR99_14985 [Cereibacter sphaeroides]QHA14408.1 hypothetical protein GQY06_14960 [Cereibacter sphaeroides]